MTSIAQSEIFFFISSIGFVILGILVAIILALSIKALNSFTRILTKIEDSLDTIGDTTMELIEDLQSNVFFRMLFNPKRKLASRKTKKVLSKED